MYQFGISHYLRQRDSTKEQAKEEAGHSTMEQPYTYYKLGRIVERRLLLRRSELRLLLLPVVLLLHNLSP